MRHHQLTVGGFLWEKPARGGVVNPRVLPQSDEAVTLDLSRVTCLLESGLHKEYKKENTQTRIFGSTEFI